MSDEVRQREIEDDVIDDMVHKQKRKFLVSPTVPVIVGITLFVEDNIDIITYNRHERTNHEDEPQNVQDILLLLYRDNKPKVSPRPRVHMKIKRVISQYVS